LTAYLASLIVVAGLACLAGARLGRRHAAHNGRLFPLAAGSALALGLVWFLAAWRARFYADTDGLGATLAEWFAHSGKWLVLLAVAAAGHGFIGGAKQIPPTAGRKVFYFAAVLGVAALVLWKTVPVYFLLGDGQRDADGFVRESEKLEVTCGAVALLNALEQFHGAKNLTEREVSKVCGVTQEGTTTAALVRAARHFGLTNATARGLTGRELEQQKLPVIVAISTLPQNRDEYLAANVFWLPPEARWHTIKAKARSPEIGKVIDDAMGAIERENPTLKGVLPRDYARPSLDKVRLGGLVDIISNIGFNESAAKSKDVLGRVYEYFLGKFASVTKVERKNDEGRKRPEGTHQTVCAANHSLVWKPAEINGSAGSRQTAFAVGNIRRRELSGSASRTKQSRVHRQMRRLIAGIGRVSLLAGTAGRGQNRGNDKVATAPRRMRRAYRHLCHDHQTSEEFRKSEVRMQNAEVTTSSFLLPFSALLSLPSSFILRTLTSPRNADSFRADLHPDLKADFIFGKASVNKLMQRSYNG
jgi:hypothetical protein